uniref:Uncharacterized protein n=1 Tax=Oryza meridionalis TaxID=40149 RepID=A0A0E0EMW1_9ORYZ
MRTIDAVASRGQRQGRDENYRCSGVKRPRPPLAPEKRKHLYVMLDDRDNAYRMHKIDVGRLGRFRRRRCSSMCFFALGSGIFATRPPHTLALVYDTDTGGHIVGPPLPNKLCGGPDINMAMADNKTMEEEVEGSSRLARKTKRKAELSRCRSRVWDVAAAVPRPPEISGAASSSSSSRGTASSATAGARPSSMADLGGGVGGGVASVPNCASNSALLWIWGKGGGACFF